MAMSEAGMPQGEKDTTGVRLPLSFEFFPPKTPEGVEKLRGVRQKLYALSPQFCSVTYGAGGAHAGEMRGCGHTLGQDGAHRGKSAFLRGRHPDFGA